MIIVVFAFVFLFLFPSSIVTHKWMFLFFHLFLRLIKYFNYNTMWCLLRMQWRMHSSEGIQSGNYRCCLFLRSTTAMSFDIKFLLVENKKIVSQDSQQGSHSTAQNEEKEKYVGCLWWYLYVDVVGWFHEIKMHFYDGEESWKIETLK